MSDYIKEVGAIATIKDIARLAGVSQGTVSNVINHKGNVSSTKIKKVLDAAAELGYTVNQQARSLRSGQSKQLAVILPQFTHRPFEEFYMEFKACAEAQGYTVTLHITEDEPSRELEIIQQLRAEMVEGIATYSCFMRGESPYKAVGFTEESVLFLERKPEFPARSICFDYDEVGRAIAQRIVRDGHERVALITGDSGYPTDLAVTQALRQGLEANGCAFKQVTTSARQSMQNIVRLFEGTLPPSAIVLNRYGLAEPVKDVWKSFYKNRDVTIYTVSPLFTLPENDFVKYELNYRLLARTAAQELIENSGEENKTRSMQLENYGFRDWTVPPALGGKKAGSISLLALDSPEAFALKSVARRYTQETGVQVRVSVYNYNEIFEILSELSHDSLFDVLRLDVTLLSWFSRKILCPLQKIDPDILGKTSGYLPGVKERYAIVDGDLYALPYSPSTQLLFYRKDLFENSVLKRVYFETYGEQLAVPQTMEKFNQIARFFTARYNATSPTKHGALLTLGNNGVIGSEFLMRFFYYNGNLYNQNGKIQFDSDAGYRALKDMVDLFEMQDGVASSWWTDTAADFANGETCMAILYSNFASDVLLSAAVPPSALGVARVPGGNPLIGGGSLGVSRFCQNPEEALRFIQWMCNEPAASASALFCGASACLKTYENFEVIGVYPWLEQEKDSFSQLKGRRKPPQNNEPFNERKMLNIIALGIKNLFSGQFSTKEALSYIQNQFEEFFITQY